MTRKTLVIIRVLWLVATCGLALAWKVEALVLLIPLAAIGPILREASPARDVDERQLLVDYRASHIALIATYVLLFLIVGRSFFQLGHEPPNEIWLLVAAPLVIRTAFAVGAGIGARRMALVLGFVCGAFWLAFATASHGLSPGSAIGLSIIAFTAAGLRWPRAAGALLVVAGLLFGIRFVVGRGPNVDWVRSLLLALTLPAPPLAAGVAFLVSAAAEQAQATDEFGDLRRSS